MILALILALMTAVAVAAVLLPVLRTGSRPSGSDVVVYRDQLDEIDRDLASGLIGKAEAEAARVEVSRRLLAAAGPGGEIAPAPSAGSGAAWARRALAAVGLVAVPLGAASAYLAFGSPRIPSQPLASRAAPQPARTIESLVAHVEQHLANNPDDGRGWEVLAPIYLRMERYDDAVKARRNALRLLGATAEREADLGQALVGQANGSVTTDARAAFERAAALDPGDVMARYFLGLAAEQGGRREEAVAIWTKLLADAPQGAAWTTTVQEGLVRLGASPDAGTVGAAPGGPPDEMILGMVSRLAERLKSDGSDLEGW